MAPAPHTSTLHLRSARVDDAEAIREIYNVEVTTGTSVFDLEPRTLEAQRRWLEERSGVHAVVVAEVDATVVGWASLSRFREKPCYATSVENSIYGAHEHLGAGVGKALLAELIRVATEHGFHTMMARIEASNQVSIALHERVGFVEVGREREIGRKFGRWLDIVQMQLML